MRKEVHRLNGQLENVNRQAIKDTNLSCHVSLAGNNLKAHERDVNNQSEFWKGDSVEKERRMNLEVMA